MKRGFQPAHRWGTRRVGLKQIRGVGHHLHGRMLRFESLEARRLLAASLSPDPAELARPLKDTPPALVLSPPPEAAETSADNQGIFRGYPLASEKLVSLDLEQGDPHHHDQPDELAVEESGFGSASLESRETQNEVTINLELTSAHLRDGSGNTISAPVLGERVAVQVNFTTENLPAAASYEIQFSVDGVVLSSGTTTLGAGGSTAGWFWWRSGWYASPGTHSVQVTVDALDTVTESNESDNTASFNFTTVQATDLPQKLIWPIEGDPFVDTTFSNYVDVDPFESSSGDSPLVLGISQRQLLESKQTVANIRRTGSTTGALTVDLTAVSNADEVSLPASVMIPDGQQRATFLITTSQDLAIDGDQIVEFTASASGHVTARNTLEVLDSLSESITLVPILPLGSSAYKHSTAGTISDPGDVVSFAFDLDVPSTISVAVDPDAGLQPTITFRDPSNSVVASNTAVAAGTQAVVQSADTALLSAGTYTVEVSSASGTGTFDAQLLLNAAFELESHDGTGNDTRGTAQDISPSIFDRPLAGDEFVGTILGDTDVVTPDWYEFSLDRNQSATVAVTGQIADGLELDLFDDAGTALATGVAANNLHQLIDDFVTPFVSQRDFFVRVDSTSAVEYSLVVTINSGFDRENNSSLAFAQDISQNGRAYGHASDSGGVTSQFDTPLLNFDGQGFNGVQPPDTVGDVGVNHYIQAINAPGGSQITIYNKADGSVALGPFELATRANPGAGNRAAGDPIVLYDHLADRWLLSEFSSVADGLSVFISQTSDPTADRWHHYFFATPEFPDYPKYAVWPDGYYVSANESSPTAYVLDRDAMLTGAAARPIQRINTVPNLAGFSFQSLTPADLDGPEPPANTPAIFMRHRDDEAHNVGANDPVQDFLEIWEFDADLDTSANSTFTKVLDLPISEFDSDLNGLTAFEAFPQPGTSILLDPLREVIMNRLQYRNFGTHETLVGNFVTDVDGTDHGGVRWFELRRAGGGSWTLHQEGTVAPDADNRFMGAIAMDGQGNIALGYNVVSSSTSASIRYIGRLAGDPLGTMPRGEFTLHAGQGFNGFNRWGDYSAMSVDPTDDRTLWFTGEYANNGNWGTRVGALQVSSGVDTDYYEFDVNSGDNLVIETTTLFDGPNLIVNDLDPALELFAPDGFSVANDDNPGGGSRNAKIMHTAGQTGAYRVAVSATNVTSGEYFLQVNGSSGADPAPFVLATTPSDGQSVPAFPGTYAVTFSEQFKLVTIDAADLTFGGRPATSVTVIDGDILEFTPNPAADIGDGTYSVSIAPGAIDDLQGNSNSAFSATVVVDRTGPRVTSTTFNGAALTSAPIDPGPLSFVANFDETLRVYFSNRGTLRTPKADDIELINNTTGEVFVPITVSSPPSVDSFTADYSALTEGAYTLTLFSGDDAFEDPLGNDLDGEPLGPGVDGTPSGNGSAGGDYTVSFVVDAAAPVLNPFIRLEPLGSLVSHSSGNSGTLHSATDTDQFTLFVEQDETIGAHVIFDDVALTDLTLEIVELGVSVSSSSSPLVLPPTPVSADDVYTLRFSTSSGAGEYEFDLLRNTSFADMVTDTSSGSPLSISSSFIPLGSGRFATIGSSDATLGGLQFTQSNNPSLFVDISGTGTALGLGDDDEAIISTVVGNSIFPAGDVTVGNNGGILSGTGLELGYDNQNLPFAFFDAALFPYWDDLYGPTPGNVWWEERLIGGHNALVVQWEREHYDSEVSTGTFQVQLFETGQVLARFVYPDVGFGLVAVDNGASATIGYQESATSAIEFSFEEPVLSDGDVLDLELFPGTSDVDYYEIDLTVKAGQTFDVVLAGHDGVDFSGELLELFDPSNTLIAVAVPDPIQAGTPAANYDLGIHDFVVTSDGTFTLRLTSQTPGEYSIVVTQSLAFETELNNSLASDPLRGIDAAGGVIGFIEDSPVTEVDLYEMTLTTGQAMRISVEAIFADPAHAPGNDLDPQLRVIDPDGSTIVAFDQDSLDGLNAVVTFFAPDDGTYTIEVGSESGAGEYLVRTEPTGPKDYGDGPASYAVGLADDGARHSTSGPRLGPTRDDETDGQPSSDASGDGDDEDGVMFGGIYAGNNMAGVNIDLQNASEARVDAWLDFGGNGVWEATDQILDNVPVSAGLQTINFSVPPGAVVGNTFARVRLSTNGDLEPTGFAADGEVEDYRVQVLSATPSVEEVVINRDHPQRSSVTELVVTFDREVTAPESAFTIRDRDSSVVLDSLVVSSSVVDGKTVSVLTFDPGNLVLTRGSDMNTLVDGNYRLEIAAAQIAMIGGGPNMSSDFTFGDQPADALFRNYGDHNGNGIVDLLDFADLRRTFAKSVGDSGYLEGLNSDADNVIGLLDFAAFRRNFG